MFNWKHFRLIAFYIVSVIIFFVSGTQISLLSAQTVTTGYSTFCEQILDGVGGHQLTSIERDVTRKLCLGQWVDMRQIGDGDSEECQPADIDGTIPENRKIRAKIVKQILISKIPDRADVEPDLELHCANSLH